MKAGPGDGRSAARLGWLFASGYVVAGVAAMWLLSPRVPYADAWRHLARLLAMPFPDSVLAPENGHPALMANLLRLLDLRLASGSQVLLTAAGIVFVLATLAIAWRLVRGLDSPPRRAAAFLCVVLGLFWLGNARTLLHGAESVHAYAVTLALFAGLWLLLRNGRASAPRADALAAILATLCGLAATFSFGSGIACFAAFAVVMVLRRSGVGFAVLVAGALAAYGLVHAAGGTGVAPAFAPLRQGDLLLRWLGGPLAYAVWPALDPGPAFQLPGLAATVMVRIALAAQAMFGPMALARWPHAALGLAGAAWWSWLCWRCWQLRGTAPAAALAGVGVSAFAIATGGLLAAMRLDYFAIHPDQLLAPRYLVWSSLFWAGLLLATVALLRQPGRAVWLAIAAAVLLLPSQVWMGKLGVVLKPTAERVATAAAVGVVAPGLWLGENMADELALSVPLSRAAGVSVHDWPVTRALGRPVPESASASLRLAATPEVLPVGNLIGDPGREVRFSHGRALCTHLLLVDADGVARGLARRDRHAGDAAWVGWMRGDAEGVPRVLDCAATRIASDAALAAGR